MSTFPPCAEVGLHCDIVAPHIMHNGGAELKSVWPTRVVAGATITGIGMPGPGTDSDMARAVSAPAAAAPRS